MDWYNVQLILEQGEVVRGTDSDAVEKPGMTLIPPKLNCPWYPKGFGSRTLQIQNSWVFKALCKM